MSKTRVENFRLLVALLLAAAACSRPTPPTPPPPTVVVAPVEQRDVPIEREWVGQTLGSADVAVRARVAGNVLGIHFEEGRPVAKGDLLFTIEPTEQQEKVAAAESDVAVARTRLAKADADLARIAPLAEMNAVSRRDLDAAVAERDAANEQVRGAEAMLNVAKLQLSYTKVIAPISGLAGISNVRVGDYVTPAGTSSTLVTLSELDPIHVRFFISESEYLDYRRRYAPGRLEAEDGASSLSLVLADGSIHPQVGRLLKIDRGIDPTTGALAVEAAFPNPAGVLRPGLFARVRAVVETRQEALLVPQRAVQELQGRYHVFVLGADDTVTLRPVTPGPRVDGSWLIDEGLAPGDRIVVEGVQKIRSGMKVSLSANSEG
ncbi:MAG: efflux RND transporter periplasmic adaptor subunit [Acidobacteria bacterium]|nr:efflux RND transporter periplasmic adaptor subunit [Acidobacteriota bacterium]